MSNATTKAAQLKELLASVDPADLKKALADKGVEVGPVDVEVNEVDAWKGHRMVEVVIPGQSRNIRMSLKKLDLLIQNGDKVAELARAQGLVD